MITDKSGLPNVGLALIRNNLEKLHPPKLVGLERRGQEQLLVIHGPGDTYESNSFGWGKEETGALSEALNAVGWTIPKEELQKLAADQSYQWRV